MKISLIALSLVLAGCATNTGVVPIGTGGYMLSKLDPMKWSGGEVKVQVMREAAAFCAKQGKTLDPITSSAHDAVMYQSSASAEVQFKCR